MVVTSSRTSCTAMLGTGGTARRSIDRPMRTAGPARTMRPAAVMSAAAQAGSTTERPSTTAATAVAAANRSKAPARARRAAPRARPRAFASTSALASRSSARPSATTWLARFCATWVVDSPEESVMSRPTPVRSARTVPAGSRAPVHLAEELTQLRRRKALPQQRKLLGLLALGVVGHHLLEAGQPGVEVQVVDADADQRGQHAVGRDLLLDPCPRDLVAERGQGGVHDPLFGAFVVAHQLHQRRERLEPVLSGGGVPYPLEGGDDLAVLIEQDVHDVVGPGPHRRRTGPGRGPGRPRRDRAARRGEGQHRGGETADPGDLAQHAGPGHRHPRTDPG